MSNPVVSDPDRTPMLGTADLVDCMAREMNVHRPVVRDALETLAKVATAALVAGRRVRLPGIGILEPRPVAARSGISPARPGHPPRPWTRPAGRRVVLIVSATLDDAVDAATPAEEAADA